MKSVEVGLGLEGFSFKSELDELIRITKILKSELDSKSKKALKEILEEIEKIYSKIVDTITPLYDLNNNTKFENQFGSKYKDFKNFYLNDLTDVGYSCNKTKEKLDQLITDHGWKSNSFRQLFNRLQRKKSDDSNEKHLKELEDSINRWYAHDKVVYHQINQLQSRINNGLTNINELFVNGNKKEALQELQSFLKDSEKLFFELKQSFQKLKQLSNELK